MANNYGDPDPQGANHLLPNICQHPIEYTDRQDFTVDNEEDLIMKEGYNDGDDIEFLETMTMMKRKPWLMMMMMMMMASMCKGRLVFNQNIKTSNILT